MAQHDMNIANQSFPDFRTDLNNVLSALNTMHSGTNRPSGAAVGTLWLDTTNSGSNSLIVKFFDGSDDITFATVDTSANTVNFSDSSTDGVLFKQEGTNFTNSLLVGHSTHGTLSNANYNTGVGIEALDALTSGGSNSALGYRALSKANAGLNNTAVGRYALFDITSGDKNTAIGDNSGFNVTGNSNITIGYQAGDNLTSSDGCVIIGNIDADSATGDKQLKIADGVDGSVNWISGSSTGVITLNAANVTQQALTSSSNAVAWDASAKPNAYHLTTENTTFSAPSNAVEGAFIALEINYDGSHTIAFNTVFEFSASTAPTFTSTDGKTDILVFRYNGAVWQEVGRTLNLSES